VIGFEGSGRVGQDRDEAVKMRSREMADALRSPRESARAVALEPRS